MLPGVLPSQLPWHLGSSTPWHLDDDDDDAVAPWQTRLVSSLFSFILFSFFYLHSVVIPSISLVLSPSAFHLCTLIKARRTEGRLAALAQDTRTRPSGLDLEPPRLEAEGWRRLGLGRSSPSFFTGHGGTLHRWGDAPLSLDSSFPFLSRSLILYFSTLSVRRGYLTCTISL